MNKKRGKVASLRGSPMAAQNEKPAETKEYGAGFATSAAGLSYRQWRAMTPSDAARFMAEDLGLNKEYRKKLETILRHFWNEPPKSANHRI